MKLRVWWRLRGVGVWPSSSDEEPRFFGQCKKLLGSFFESYMDAEFRNVFEKRNRPQLVMTIFLPLFQILTGLNSIMFYAPVLFQTMGFGGEAFLYALAFTGGVLAFSFFISLETVDRLGHRVLVLNDGSRFVQDSS